MSSKVNKNENRHLQDLEVDREGINSLAAWQSLDSDKESLIYRKFGYLSARRSLHLQNKLLDLENQLEDLDAKVRQGDTEAKKSLRKHEIFVQRSTTKDSIDEQRMILLDKIDAALNKYRMYVASFSSSSLKRADRRISSHASRNCKFTSCASESGQGLQVVPRWHWTGRQACLWQGTEHA